MAISSSRQYSSALSVSVKPHQSSFFAGEEMACTITFTNTNPKVTHTQPIPQTTFFPQGNYSIGEDGDEFVQGPSTPASPAPQTPFSSRRVVSSTPFSKSHIKSKSVDVRTLLSPTKPLESSGSAAVTPDGNLTRSRRSKALLRQMDGEQLPERKGLIGSFRSSSENASSEASSSSLVTWSKLQSSLGSVQRQHTKSASVAVPHSSTANDRNGLGLGTPSSPLPSDSSATRLVPPAQAELAKLQTSPSPARPQAASMTHGSSARKTSATISAQHPHSRKKSVAQTQAEDLTEAFELDPSGDRAVSAPSTSTSASSSASTPSTPLGRNPSQNTPWGNENFYRLGQNDTMESVFRESINDWSQDMRKQGLPNAGGTKSPLYPNNDLLPPGTEKILWSFAQFGGVAEIDESLIKPGDFENLKQRLAYGDMTGAAAPTMPGTPRGAIGGGDLGYGDADADGFNGSGGSSSWGGYLWHALGSGGGSAGSRGRHRRTGSTLQDTRERTLQSRSVPTFSAPPSILAVDLTLGPEESKSYTFRIQLPVDLPPSYEGKAIRFKYSLSIGTNKLDTAANALHTQRSRLIQVPIRVYNFVATTGVRPFYDLMNPVILLREQAGVEAIEGSGSTLSKHESTPRREAHRKGKITKSELESYVRDQLRPRSPSKALTVTGDSSQDGIDPFGASEGLQQESCKIAIEVLSRTSTKVSYDISKDGKVAAVLTLVKSRYRLGDTVMGVISINEGGSLARIARIAATLETFEEVQPTIALLPAGRMQRMTRVVHAEHHESTLDKGRASFTLPIPSGASPEFETSGVKLNWTLRLSFLTIARVKTAQSAVRPPPPPHLMPTSSDGFKLYHTSFRALPCLAGSVPTLLRHPPKEGAEDEDETKLETVECAVPVTVLPNSTGFKVGPAVFSA